MSPINIWLGLGFVGLSGLYLLSRRSGASEYLPSPDVSFDISGTLGLTPVGRHNEGYYYRNSVPFNTDGDGAPDCYAPLGSGLPARDYLANAGHPGNWYGVVTDSGQSDGEPVIAPNGYYVSSTSLVDGAFDRTDQRRYLDSSHVNFLAMGRKSLTAMGAKMGDLGVALDLASHNLAGFVIGDGAGNNYKMSEGSIALNQALGYPGNPKGGKQPDIGALGIVIFPGTSLGWPNDSYGDSAVSLFNQWGGEATLRSLLGVP